MGGMNENEQLFQDYRTAACLYQSTDLGETAAGVGYANRAASAAWLLAFSGDEPLEIWQEIAMKWVAVACSQAQALPLAIAQ